MEPTTSPTTNPVPGRSRKLAVAAALLLGAGVGAVAGGLVGGPGISGAAESPAAAVDVGGPFGHGRPGLEAAAEAIGITVDELRTELQGGQTIAEVAAGNGVDVQTVIDAVVADAHARIDERLATGEITEEEADELRARASEIATDLVNGELPFNGAGLPGGPGRGGHRHFPGLATAAEAIGVEPAELVEAVRGGQTVAEVAEANGVDPQAVIDALVAEATERITAFVNGDG